MRKIHQQLRLSELFSTLCHLHSVFTYFCCFPLCCFGNWFMIEFISLYFESGPFFCETSHFDVNMRNGYLAFLFRCNPTRHRILHVSLPDEILANHYIVCEVMINLISCVADYWWATIKYFTLNLRIFEDFLPLFSRPSRGFCSFVLFSLERRGTHAEIFQGGLHGQCISNIKFHWTATVHLGKRRKRKGKSAVLSRSKY